MSLHRYEVTHRLPVRAERNGTRFAKVDVGDATAAVPNEEEARWSLQGMLDSSIVCTYDRIPCTTLIDRSSTISGWHLGFRSHRGRPGPTVTGEYEERRGFE